MLPIIKKGQAVAHYDFEEKPLASELWLKIFSHIKSAEDVVSLGLTTHDLYEVFFTKDIWKGLLMRHFPNSLVPNQLKIEPLNHYKKFTAIENNIKKCAFTINTLKFDFQDNEEPCCQVYGNYLFHSGSDSEGPIVEVFDLTTQKKLRDFKVEGYISSLHVHGNCLFVGGSYDCEEADGDIVRKCMIEIWNLDSLEYVETLYSQLEGTINCLCSQGDDLYLGIGRSVVAWNLKSKVLGGTITFPEGESIIALRVRGKHFFIETENKGNFSVEIYQLEYLNRIVRAPDVRKNLNFEIFENLQIVNSQGIIQVWDISILKEKQMEHVESKICTYLSRAHLFQMYNGCLYMKDAGKIHILDFNPESNQ